MRSGSPQVLNRLHLHNLILNLQIEGYSGRRAACGAGNGGMSKGQGDIWEVVSALANALQDARNQLVNLMNTTQGQTPMRLYGGRTNSYESCDSRFPNLSPGPRSLSVTRNVHRGHAHGHVAFGLNSEFPLQAATPNRRRRRARSAIMSAQRAARISVDAATTTIPPGRCTHPLHSMGAAARSLTPRRVQANWPSSRVSDCRKSHCDELSRRDRACVNISSTSRNPAGLKNNDSTHRRGHGHCLGTQFISLLKQEAHQIRERRLAEESFRDRRPSWSHC